jgi:endonuclease G
MNPSPSAPRSTKLHKNLSHFVITLTADVLRGALVVGLLCLSAVSGLARDIVDIKTSILLSHFSQKVREPLYVSYALYKGGGDCSRSGMSFKNDHPEIKTASAKDYSHSGYDIGHMANAEDFAADCKKEKMTFVFYNALPQTPNLNRGIWKRVETDARKWSQKKHLLIICGGYAFQEKGLLYVPTHCFKVVQDVSTGQILFCGIFANNNHATKKDITEPALERVLKYKLPIRLVKKR